jgi:hypothetical protein
MEVDAVEECRRDPGAIACERGRRAEAAVARGAEPAAGARVHHAYELKGGRDHDRPAAAGYGDAALLGIVEIYGPVCVLQNQSPSVTHSPIADGFLLISLTGTDGIDVGWRLVAASACEGGALQAHRDAPALWASHCQPVRSSTLCERVGPW